MNNTLVNVLRFCVTGLLPVVVLIGMIGVALAVPNYEPDRYADAYPQVQNVETPVEIIEPIEVEEVQFIFLEEMKITASASPKLPDPVRPNRTIVVENFDAGVPVNTTVDKADVRGYNPLSDGWHKPKPFQEMRVKNDNGYPDR